MKAQGGMRNKQWETILERHEDIHDFSNTNESFIQLHITMHERSIIPLKVPLTQNLLLRIPL